MKFIVFLFSITFLTVFVGGGVFAQDHIGAKAILQWDAVTTDIDGNPETVAHYEVAAFPIGAVLNPPEGTPETAPIANTKVQVAGDVTQAAVGLFLAGIMTGSNILVTVRAVDPSGNTSDWGTPLNTVVDFKKPAKPKPWWKFW